MFEELTVEDIFCGFDEEGSIEKPPAKLIRRLVLVALGARLFEAGYLAGAVTGARSALVMNFALAFWRGD